MTPENSHDHINYVETSLHQRIVTTTLTIESIYDSFIVVFIHKKQCFEK